MPVGRDAITDLRSPWVRIPLRTPERIRKLLIRQLLDDTPFHPERGVPWLVPVAADVTVVYLNLKGFKRINDEFGLNVGDLVLRSVAARIQVAAGRWPAYRWTADEFLVFARLPVEQVAAFEGALRRAIDGVHEVGTPSGRLHRVQIQTTSASVRARPGWDAKRLADEAGLMDYRRATEARNRPSTPP
jgi:diguanylate cyclase (GGDEF)-like protein